MQKQLIIIGILSLIFVIALWIQKAFFPHPTHRETIYFLYVFWICGALIFILAVNLLWQRLANRQAPRDQQHSKSLFTWPNRRKCFRVVYPDIMRPTLIVEKVDRQPKRHLEFRIVDLSEEGLCFLDDGSLGPATDVAGRIIFKQGENKHVAGQIVRRHDHRICVHLHRTIAWETILKEQRQMLSQTKPLKP